MEHYVYVYLDTRKPGQYIYQDLKFDYEPFYVGQGKNNRCYSGLKNGGSFYKRNKINKIFSDGFEPVVKKIYENIDFEIAVKLEIDTIKKIGRKDINKGPLVNLTDGGEGTRNISKIIKNRLAKERTGSKRTEKSREKMRLARKKYFEKGNTTWNKGKSWSDDMRKKLTNKSFLGRSFTEEHRNKISQNSKRQLLEGNSIAKPPKIVSKYTMTGDFIEEYESIKMAALKNNIPPSSIRSCCIKKLKHAGNFYWEFKNKE